MATSTADIQESLLLLKRRKAEILLEQLGVNPGPVQQGEPEQAPPLLNVIAGGDPEAGNPALAGALDEGGEPTLIGGGNFSTGERAQLAGAFALNPEEVGIADTLRSLRPDTRVEEDAGGNLVVEFGPKAGDLEGQRFSVNPEGLDRTDIAQISANMLMFAPGAGFGARGATAVTRFGRTAAAEGGTSIAIDIGAQELGSQQPVSMSRAIEAAVIGGVIEVAARPVVGAIRGIIAKPIFFQKGQLTERGKKAAKAAGLDPDQLDSATQEFFAESRAKGRNPQAAAGEALERRFGVPLTRGEKTGSPAQAELEEAGRQGVLGTDSQNVLLGQRQRRDARIGEASERELEGISGVRRTGEDATEFGGIIREGVQRNAQILQDNIDKAFADARLGKAEFTGKSIAALFKGFKEAAEDFPLDKKLTPKALSALAEVRRLSKKVRAAAKARDNGQIRAVDFSQFELTRRKLNKILDTFAPGENRTDKALVTIIKRKLDGFVDDAFYNDLFSGNKEVLSLFKKARSLRSEFGKQFEPQNRSDTVGKIMQKLVVSDPTNKEAANLILGLGRIGSQGRGVAASVTRRLADILGPDSDEFNALRETVFLRIVNDGKKVSGPRVQKNINDAFRNDKELMDSLFTKDHQNKLRTFGKLLDRTILPDEAGNSSLSGFRIASILGRVVGAGLAPGSTLVAQAVGAKAGQSVSSRLFGGGRAARLATKGLPDKSSKAVTAGAIAGKRQSGIDLEAEFQGAF